MISFKSAGQFIARKMGVQPVVKVTRVYKAANQSRLTADLGYDYGTTPAEVMASLEPARNGSRQQCKNNAYAKKWLTTLKSNVVGENGFVLNCTAGDVARDGTVTLDKTAIYEIESNFHRWANNPLWCDMSGRKTLRQICNLETVATNRDGECFIRMIQHSTKHKNPYAFGLKVYPADALDERYNTILANGNEVVNGVEIDSWGEPLAYHFKKKSKASLSSNPWSSTSEHTRILAKDIIHHRLNIDEEEDVYRGFPTLLECLDKFHTLNKYDQAELEAAREAACTIDTYSRDPGIMSDDDEVADFDEVSSAMVRREPGMSRITPEGWKVETNSPNRPNQAYEAFHKANLREITCGMLVDYNTLSNDMESISWSSLRENKLAVSDVYKLFQKLAIETTMIRIYEAWLSNFLASPLTNLPYAKYEKFRSHTWLARRWQWVNPSQEAKANQTARDYGWKTDADIAAEMGKDYSENVAKIKMVSEQAKGTYLEDNYAKASEKQESTQPTA